MTKSIIAGITILALLASLATAMRTETVVANPFSLPTTVRCITSASPQIPQQTQPTARPPSSST